MKLELTFHAARMYASWLGARCSAASTYTIEPTASLSLVGEQQLTRVFGQREAAEIELTIGLFVGPAWTRSLPTAAFIVR